MIEPFHTEFLARYTQGRMQTNPNITLPEYMFALQYMMTAAYVQGITSMVNAVMFGSHKVLAPGNHGEKTPDVRRRAR
jgi:hypothetical protein